MAQTTAIRKTWKCAHCGNTKRQATKPFFIGCKENEYGHEYARI